MFITKKLLKKEIIKAKERIKISDKILSGINKKGVICKCCEHSEMSGDSIYCKTYNLGGCYVMPQYADEFLFEPMQGVMNSGKSKGE